MDNFFISTLVLITMFFGLYCFIAYLRTIGSGRKIKSKDVVEVLRPVIKVVEVVVDKVVDGGKRGIRTISKKPVTTYEREFHFKEKRNETKKSKMYKDNLDKSRKEYIKNSMKASKKF